VDEDRGRPSSRASWSSFIGADYPFSIGRGLLRRTNIHATSSEDDCATQEKVEAASASS